MEIFIITASIIVIVSILVGIAINIWVARFQVRGQTYPLYCKHTNKGQQMEIQVITETKAIYMPFAPVNKLSADEYNAMREMLKEAEALGVIRDWSIY